MPRTTPSLRWVAALLLLVTAAAHLPLIPGHLHEAPYVGVLFIALVVSCSVLAVVLVVHETAMTWELTAALALLALAAFLASRTVGLPQLDDDIGHWADPLGIPAIVAELLTTMVAARALARRHATTKEGIS